MPRVVVGLSGGVDSAVAALLLMRQGYEVIGVTLQMTGGPAGDAARVAAALGIEYHEIDCSADFRDHVIEPFISEYLCGRTPNPCTVCNPLVKWQGLRTAQSLYGADYAATGHYAQIVQKGNGRYTVQRSSHIAKDQSYMLYRLTQQELMSTLLPLSNYSKQEVRAIATKAGLPVADSPDSEDICFVPDGDYAGFIEAHADCTACGGDFVDTEGRALGRHRGIYRYTVGQRKGLGLALGYPAYIKSIDPQSRNIVVAPLEDISRDSFNCSDLCFMGMSPPAKEVTFTADVQVRYRHRAVGAVVTISNQADALVQMAQPEFSVTPGQSAVFYDTAGCVLGGGVIV